MNDNGIQTDFKSASLSLSAERHVMPATKKPAYKKSFAKWVEENIALGQRIQTARTELLTDLCVIPSALKIISGWYDEDFEKFKDNIWAHVKPEETAAEEDDGEEQEESADGESTPKTLLNHPVSEEMWKVIGTECRAFELSLNKKYLQDDNSGISSDTLFANNCRELVNAIMQLRPHDDQLTELTETLRLAQVSLSHQGYGELVQKALQTQRKLQSAKAEMLKANLGLVHRFAKGYFSRISDARESTILDLIQEGTIGLFKAINHFDPNRGATFAPYAQWWIKKAIHISLVKYNSLIKISRRTMDDLKKLKILREQWIKEQGREPTIDEIGDALHITKESAEKLCAALSLLQRIKELDAPIVGHEEGDSTLSDFIPDNRAVDAFDFGFKNLHRVFLTSLMLRHLKPREERILRMRMGLNLPDAMTLDESSLEMGVTKERIRQIEEKAIEKLKKALALKTSQTKPLRPIRRTAKSNKTKTLIPGAG